MNRTPPLPVVLAMTGASGAPYAVRLLEVLLQSGQDLHLSISPSAQTVLWQELGLRVSLEHFELHQLLRTPEGKPWTSRWPAPPPASESPGGIRPDSGHPGLGSTLGGPAAFPAESPAAFPAEFPAESPAAFPAESPASPPAELAPPPRGKFFYHHYKDFMTPIASGSHRTAGMVVCPCSGGTLSSIVTGASGNLIERAAEVHLKERRKLILVPRETPLSLGYVRNMEQASAAGAVVLPAMPGWYHGVTGLLDLIDFIVARILDQLEIEHQLMHRWGEEPHDV
jgi:flavin prenyltransferase